MSFSASIFGFDDESKLLISVREIDYRGTKIKVRIPVKKEYEAILEKIRDIPNGAIDKKYEELVEQSKSSGEKLEEVDGVATVDGQSVKELAKKVLSLEANIVEHFKLLIPANPGEGKNKFDMKNLTIAMIDEQFPEAVKFELVKKIQDALQPDYEAAKKN